MNSALYKYCIKKINTLIDNIFINKHEKLNFAGILNNEISDHQIVAVDMDLVIPPNKTYYITVFSNSDQTKQNFKNDLESKNIYDMLNKESNANPNEIYLILQTAITDSMKTHLTKKVIKFNRKKHKRDPWMTYGILNSVNRKNLLYKKLMKINRDSLLFDTKKQEFNAYKNNPLLHAIRNNGIRFFSFWNSKENVSNKVIPKKKFLICCE